MSYTFSQMELCKIGSDYVYIVSKQGTKKAPKYKIKSLETASLAENKQEGGLGGVTKLTLDESAILVGLLPAPAIYSPKNHPEQSYERRNFDFRQ